MPPAGGPAPAGTRIPVREGLLPSGGRRKRGARAGRGTIVLVQGTEAATVGLPEKRD